MHELYQLCAVFGERALRDVGLLPSRNWTSNVEDITATDDEIATLHQAKKTGCARQKRIRVRREQPFTVENKTSKEICLETESNLPNIS
jgi:hypothetical protein